MAFMMFRLICKFCDWSMGITSEIDASYSVNFFASHLLDHVFEVSEWLAEQKGD